MEAIDLSTGRVLWTTPQLPGGDLGHRVEFTPDGSTVLATALDGSRSAWLFQLDALTGQQRGETVRGWGSTAVAPDGKTVATGRLQNDELYIDVLDLPSGRRKSSWRAGTHKLRELLFSPDGKSLSGVLTEGGRFNEFLTVSQIWDSGTGRPTCPIMARTDMAMFTRSQDRLVTLTDHVQQVRDSADGRVRGSVPPADGWWSASHPDGRTVLVSARDNTVRLWQVSADAEPVSDRATGKHASMTGIAANCSTRDPWFFRAGLRMDGKIAISLARGAAGRELIRLSDPSSGRPSGSPAPHYPGWSLRSLAFSPDGRSFATGSHPRGRTASEVRLWDAQTGRLLFPPIPHTNWVAALAFHPDGKVLAAGDYNGLVRFWDTSTGREIGRPLAQGEIVMSLAYSPDGNMLAVGLAADRTGKPGTRLWDTTTRQPISGLLPGPDTITRIGSGRMVEPCWRVSSRGIRRPAGCGTRREGKRSVSPFLTRPSAGSIPVAASSSHWGGTARSSSAMPRPERFLPGSWPPPHRRTVQRFAAMTLWSPWASTTARSGSATWPRISRSAHRGS